MRDGARSHVANPALEAQRPIFVRRLTGVARVDGERHVAARIRGTLAQHTLVRQRAFAPVNVAWIIAFTHQAQTVNFVAGTAPQRAFATEAGARLHLRQAHRIDGGIDDELIVRRDLARLFEQPKGEARRYAKPDVIIATTTRRRAPIGRD